MQEPPVITIVDPDGPGVPGDVLVAGSERPPLRLPRRALILGWALVLLTAGAAVGVDRYREHRADLRRAAAAFAVADTVHVHVTLSAGGLVSSGAGTDGTYPLDGSSPAEPLTPATGLLDLPLTVSDDPGSYDTISAVSLRGSDLSLKADPALLNGRVPGTVLPVLLACAPVAAGHYPSLGSLVVTVVPRSGRSHRIVLPLTSSVPAKELALTTCGLPDPAALPTATLEEQQGDLLLELAGVPRSTSALHLLAIRSPGLALAPVGGELTVDPGVSLLMGVSTKVTDCAAARTGRGVVTVLLRDDRRTYAVVAADAAAQRFIRPGSAWLRATIARAC